MFCNFFDREIARFVLRPKVDWGRAKMGRSTFESQGPWSLGPPVPPPPGPGRILDNTAR